MTLDILRKHGGWCVELQQPLKYRGDDVSAIELRRPTAEQTIRWSNWQIPSTLALLSELCGLPEKLIRQLPSDDFERVMFALTNVVPPWLKTDMDEGKRPLATPDEVLAEAEQAVVVPDQQDPRFPAVDGPVVRLREREPKPTPPPEKPINLAPPATSEVVS